MIEINPVNRLDLLVNLNVTPGFDEQFKEKIRDGDPLLIFTHEAHADGIGVAVCGEHLIKLSREVGRMPRLRGFVMPVARSLVDGQQSRWLQISFHFFNFLLARKGLKTFGYTREKDEKEYGMDRAHTIRELMPMARRVKQGYVPAVFAGGSVEAGRHDEGSDPENIHGLQRLEGTDLLTISRLVKGGVNSERRMFFVIGGLHGGFRLQSPNKERLHPTKEGLATFFGLPERFIPHVRMEANLGTIISESQMADRFGKDWIRVGRDKNGDNETVQAINDFIMREAVLLIPPHARGVYAGIGKNLLAV